MLLPPAEKKQLLDSLNRPVISALAKKAIKKKIIEKCKKIAHCPYCEALNGEKMAVFTHPSPLTLLGKTGFNLGLKI